MKTKSTFDANAVYGYERELEDVMEHVGSLTVDELHSRLMRISITKGRLEKTCATLAEALYKSIELVAKYEMRNNRRNEE